MENFDFEKFKKKWIFFLEIFKFYNGGAVIRTSYLGKFCIKSKKNRMKKVASQIDADSTILFEKNTKKLRKKS